MWRVLQLHEIQGWLVMAIKNFHEDRKSCVRTGREERAVQ